MKVFILGLILSIYSVSVLADTRFTCSYRDSYQVQKKGKVKTRYGKAIIKIKGKLSSKTGGRIYIKSDYHFGTKKRQRVQLYKVKRKNEANFSYAKFHNKTPSETKSKKWVASYLKFSLPKKQLKNKKTGFTAYVGLFKAKDAPSLDSSDPTTQLSSDELSAFNEQTNEVYEYKLWCEHR